MGLAVFPEHHTHPRAGESHRCPNSSPTSPASLMAARVRATPGIQALQPGRGGRGQDAEGSPAVLGGLLAHVQQPAVRPLRRGDGRAPLGRRQPTRSPTRSGRPRPRSSSSRSSAPRSTPSTTATWPPKARPSSESHANLDEVVKVLKDEQERTGIKLLWGTANLFTNPRYMHGAATSPNLDVFAYAAAQVKKAMEVTHDLGGDGYTFWGGREGYSTLYNTDMKRELDHLARFLHMAVDYKKQIGFTGTFYIEPKPKEPTKHQYDSDAAACLNFLRTYDLLRPLQAQPRDQPRDPRRPRDDARAGGRHRRRGPRLDRRQHRRPAARLGHRPVPDEHLPHHPVHALHPGDGRVHDRRRELRRQGPPRELRADRPLPRPHRRHGRLRPRPQDRPRDHRRRPARRRSSRSATGAGTASSAAGSSPARRASPTSKPTSSPRARSRGTRAAARRCSRT